MICIRFSARDQSRLHHFGRIFLPGTFLGYALIARRICKGDTLVADIEALENMGRVRKPSSKNQCKRSVDATKGVNFFFYSQSQMEQQNCQEETTNSENPLQGENKPEGSEDLSGGIQGEPEGSQPTEPTDDAEAQKDFWSIHGDFIYRHHMEPRVQLCVPNEETFPVPLKYIDVTNLYKSGCVARKNVLTTIGTWT